MNRDSGDVSRPRKYVCVRLLKKKIIIRDWVNVFAKFWNEAKCFTKQKVVFDSLFRNRLVTGRQPIIIRQKDRCSNN